MFVQCARVQNDENHDDANHPFGNWIHDVKTWHAIGAYRLVAFSNSGVMQMKVLTHIHPYFNPFIPMLTNFCDIIFGTYALEGECADKKPTKSPWHS